jgi:hypothetical protein
VLLSVGDRLQLHAVAHGLRYLDGPSPSRSGVSVAADYSIAKDLGVRVEVDVRREFGFRWSTVGAVLSLYF